MSEEEWTLWSFNVTHFRRWWDIAPHAPPPPHTHTYTRMHACTLWDVWNQISSNLYSGVMEPKTHTQMITSHTHTCTHYMLACRHICKPASDTHADIHTHADAHLRSNPGRFISRGLQHSGCLSHFIGHRGRTGMGLFKSNPARPTHTYTRTHTHAYTLFCLAA